MSEITISSSESSYALSVTTAEVMEDGRVIVTHKYAPYNWRESYNYREKRRYFKNKVNAVKKLRKDYAYALAQELEDGEMVEAGDASWRDKPYPITSAIKKLEELETAK
ncbi:MAG: hypothetical protein CMC15_13565 [Flavobacteriaceae bacterium]|nr:hypothetical protein [Flavobacteriaceae bacterium]|tara:strand:+ start:562 stop:888 length:327 start_codon:yes stop_codon:yes gene_type:complete